jgi:AraC-like DNA-binding protein
MKASSWAEQNRIDIRIENCDPSVRERLALPAISKCGVSQPCRPVPLRNDPELAQFYGPDASLASRARLSERTFYRRFIAATGRTPAAFIQGARLELARTLLLTALPLKSVAARSGLGSTAWLNATFKRRFGLMPSTFRELHRTSPANGWRKILG